MKIHSIVCLFFLLLLCSCQKKTETNRQQVRLNIGTEPPTLDARKASDTVSITMIKMCFEGLMRRAQDGSFEYGIAEKYEATEDKIHYIFYLRDANWWDGVKITAHDFEQTWKIILNPAFPSPFSNDLYVLKNGEAAKKGLCPLDEVGVKALNDQTLEITLDHPCPYIIDLISSHSFLAVPIHIAKKYPNWAENAGDHFVGNGPFKLTKWRHHNQLIFEKNPDYWDKDAVLIEEINFSIIPDEMTELNMYESGELDWAGCPLSNLPADALYALKKQNRLHCYPMAGVYYYVFNIKEPPFNNVNLRKAFTLAINRKDIIENITQSGQISATGFVPPIIRKQEIDFFKDHDLVEAKRLFDLALKEMGLDIQELPPITLSYNTTSGHHRIAQAIAQGWHKAFGVKIVLSNKEWKVFLDELSHGQFQVARMGGVSSFNDPISFLNLFRYENSCNNFSAWTNLEYSSLLDQADRTTDPVKRESILLEAEKIFLGEMPVAPIYFYTGSYLKKPHLKNISVTEFAEIDFKNGYLEKK